MFGVKLLRKAKGDGTARVKIMGKGGLGSDNGFGEVDWWVSASQVKVRCMKKGPVMAFRGFVHPSA
jgi:hypothetical protein